MDFNNNNVPEQNGTSNQNGNPSQNKDPDGGSPDQNGSPYGYPYRTNRPAPGSAFANASLVLGIISIITGIMMTFYFPFIFGCLAVLFALLSKGQAAKTQKPAKAGLICGIAGVFFNLIIIVYSILFILSNPSFLLQSAQMYDSMCEQIYGVPSEEILGDSMENIITDFLNSH